MTPAKTPAKTAPKVLRIGMLRGGKLVDDRYFLKHEDVTVGESSRNMFVTESSVQVTHRLFVHKGARYQLVFNDDMTGYVSVDGKDVEFNALKSHKPVKKSGTSWTFPLTDEHKGRVVVGEAPFLFQFVPPPPTPPAPALPSAARGSLWNTMDRTFVTILAGSFLFHFMTMLTVTQRNVPPSEPGMEEIPDRFAKILMPEKPIEEEKPKEDDAKAEEEKPAEDKKEEKKAEDKPKTEAEHKAAVAKVVSNKGLVKLLGAVGSGGNSALANVFAAGAGFSGDIDSAIAGAGGGIAIATDGSAGGGPRGAGSATASSIGDVGTSGGGKVSLKEKRDAEVHGSVSSDADADVDSTTVDKEALNRYIKGRMKSLQSCYERELKRNPGLRGKLVVRFTIGTRGQITEVDITSNSLGDDEVGSCVSRLIKTWHFPFTPEADASVEFPFIFTPT